MSVEFSFIQLFYLFTNKIFILFHSLTIPNNSAINAKPFESFLKMTTYCPQTFSAEKLSKGFASIALLL